MERFQARDGDGLGRLLTHEPRALRHIYGRLWDVDEGIRRTAAIGLGVAGANRPELGRELLRRVLWGLQDEAATNGGPAIPILTEIAIRKPDVARPFLAPVVSMIRDEGLRPEIRRTVERIADAEPQLVAELVERLERGDPTGTADDRDWLNGVASGGRGGRHGT